MIPTTSHVLATRLLHACLAIAVIIQLGASQFMNDKGGGNLPFWVHQYVGLAAFAIVLGFWVATLVRRRGTPVCDLFPWGDAKHRNAVLADIKLYISTAKARKMPLHADHSPLPSAIHGLGLLLITLMVVTGTYFYFFTSGIRNEGGLPGYAMNLHRAFANLVWIYLIGHAGLSVLNHIAGTLSLRAMWSLKGNSK